MYGRSGTNWFHRREVGRIDVILLYIRQATSVHLIRSNPAPPIDPVSLIVKQNDSPYFSHLLFGHVSVELPLRQQGDDLFEIEVCDWNCRHLLGAQGRFIF